MARSVGRSPSADCPSSLVVEAATPQWLPDQAFRGGEPLSDHSPQVYSIHAIERLAGGSSDTSCAEVVTQSSCGGARPALLEVLTWNVMHRGRSGQKGRHRSAREGQTLTNNGLDSDESPEAYELRFLGGVVPLVSRWLSSGTPGKRSKASEQPVPPRVACLQEFPMSPLLQDDALERLRTESCRRQLQLAVRPRALSSDGNGGNTVGPATYCNAILWDADSWASAKLVPEAELGPSVLGIVLSLHHERERCALPGVRLFSAHLPFVDMPGGPRYAEALASARRFLAAVTRSTSSTHAVVVAGDLNADVRKVLEIGPSLGIAASCVADSSTFRGASLTTDACVAAGGCFTSSQTSHAVRDGHIDEGTSSGKEGGVWHAGASAPFFGLTRKVFLNTRLHRNLQEDPRLWYLNDKAIGTLGLWPFSDQLQELERLFRRCKEAEEVQRPAQKRLRLPNPLASQSDGHADESSEESVSSDASPGGS